MDMLRFYEAVGKEIDAKHREMYQIIDTAVQNGTPAGQEIAEIRHYIMGLNKALDMAMAQSFDEITEGINNAQS